MWHHHALHARSTTQPDVRHPIHTGVLLRLSRAASPPVLHHHHLRYCAASHSQETLAWQLSCACVSACRTVCLCPCLSAYRAFALKLLFVGFPDAPVASLSPCPSSSPPSPNPLTHPRSWCRTAASTMRCSTSSRWATWARCCCVCCNAAAAAASAAAAAVPPLILPCCTLLLRCCCCGAAARVQRVYAHVASRRVSVRIRMLHQGVATNRQANSCAFELRGGWWLGAVLTAVAAVHSPCGRSLS